MCDSDIAPVICSRSGRSIKEPTSGIEQETTGLEPSNGKRKAEIIYPSVEAETAGRWQRASVHPPAPVGWKVTICKSEIGYFLWVYQGAEEQN